MKIKKYLKLIEGQCNVLFLSVFGIELSKMREKESLEAGPGPWSRMGCSPHATLLCYVSNFQPQKLEPPLAKS